jgi:acyl carrier protein
MEVKPEETIIEKVNRFLVEEFEVEAEKITPQANLQQTLGLDSLDYIDLGVVIESNFGFKVKHEDFVTIQTFQNLYDYVISRAVTKVMP